MPRQKPRQVKAKPIRTRDEFKAVHLAVEARIDRYAASPRADYAKLAPWVARDSSPQMARYFNANNMRSRIKLAGLLLVHLHAEPAIKAGPLYFVTVVSRDYVVPLKDAMSMSSDELHRRVYRLQQLTRQALQGIPFIGMVEPGLYKGWRANGPQPMRIASAGTPTYSPGVSMRTASARLGRHVNISGGRALHWKSIGFDELDVHALYIPKAPLKEYRLNAKVGDKFDTETGEFFVKYRQQKRDMRTGDRLRVANALRHLNLDDLLFAGGTGRPIATAVEDEALEAARREEAADEVLRVRARRAIAAGRHHLALGAHRASGCGKRHCSRKSLKAILALPAQANLQPQSRTGNGQTKSCDTDHEMRSAGTAHIDGDVDGGGLIPRYGDRDILLRGLGESHATRFKDIGARHAQGRRDSPMASLLFDHYRRTDELPHLYIACMIGSLVLYIGNPRLEMEKLCARL